MKPYLVETTFDCIKAGDKFRYEPLGETFLKIKIIMLSSRCAVNCVKIKTGNTSYISKNTNIYVKG